MFVRINNPKLGELVKQQNIAPGPEGVQGRHWALQNVERPGVLDEGVKCNDLPFRKLEKLSEEEASQKRIFVRRCISETERTEWKEISIQVLIRLRERLRTFPKKLFHHIKVEQSDGEYFDPITYEIQVPVMRGLLEFFIEEDLSAFDSRWGNVQIEYRPIDNIRVQFADVRLKLTNIHTGRVIHTAWEYIGYVYDFNEEKYISDFISTLK